MASNNIDVIGYSLGGVIAIYLAQIRKINNLILLAPALKYLNIKKYKANNNISIRNLSPKKDKKRYLLTFVYLVHYVKTNLDRILCKTLIICGKDDYLVKEEAGHLIYNICKNKKKGFIVLENINHFNIVNSNITIKYINDFINIS